MTLSKEVIPEASQVRDESYRLYRSGEKSVGDFISAQLEFNQVVKQFLDTAIRHRRSMLGINTAVGRRSLAVIAKNRLAHDLIKGSPPARPISLDTGVS